MEEEEEERDFQNVHVNDLSERSAGRRVCVVRECLCLCVCVCLTCPHTHTHTLTQFLHSLEKSQIYLSHILYNSVTSL